MNKWKAFTPLAIAIILGLLAARVATSVVTATPAAIVAEQTNLTPIAVAAHDMDAGTTLGAADVTMTKVESTNLPAGAFTTSAAAMAKVTKLPLVKGQPILATGLADDGSGAGVAATLPKGMRAITVDINDTTGVAGFLLPQSKVDVVTTLSIDGKATAKTLMGGVTVLAVGTRTNPNAPTDGSTPPPQQQAAHTVTLLVNPKDAEKLELAATTSRIRLVLRNGRDVAVEPSNGVTLADLRGNAGNNGGADPFATVADTTAAPATQPSTKNWTIQIINGGAVSSQSFEVPNTPAKPAESNDAPAESTVSTEHEAR